MGPGAGGSGRGSLKSSFRMALSAERRYTGTRRMALAERNSRSKRFFLIDMSTRNRKKTYVVCLSNEGYRASLVVRRIYLALSDSEAQDRVQLRVVDESGDDYLFPEALFEPIELPSGLRRKLAAAT